MDAVPFLITSMILNDLMKGTPALKDYVVGMLVSQWGMDQLFENAAKVKVKDSVLTFIKLPDGTYSSPPGVTMKLIKDAGLFRIEERFGGKVEFNAANKISLWKDVDQNTMTFTYDIYGSPKATQTGTHQPVNHVFDYTPSSKLEKVTYKDLSTVTFSYDQHDKLTSMTDAAGTTSYTYDNAYRLISSTDPNDFTILYTYDEAGNLTSVTYPGNKTVNYFYDNLNRLKTVTNWYYRIAIYTYDASSRLTNTVNFNGTKTIYTYDRANRLKILENRKADNSVISTYAFTLDANGNRTEIIQDEPLVPIVDDSSTAFAYNTQKNRLLTAGTVPFAYDNEGQLSNKGGTPYTFDFEHRLKTIGAATTFTYDGKGNRIKAVRNGVTTKYIYDAAGNLVAEASAGNVITKYYIYGSGLLAMFTQGNVYNYHFNATGSVIAMTDYNKNIVNKYAYTPFGIIGDKVEAINQPFTFVGQFGVMTEPEGFYYMRARYYDPSVGRFISEDPIGFEGGDLNLFGYVGNNPVMFVDPSGLYWFRQLWQTDYVVGRDKSIVPPGGPISRFIEDYVPAGRTFGEMHDSFVDAATKAGLPDWLVNKPSMISAYGAAVSTEILRTVGIFDQPVSPATCK